MTLLIASIIADEPDALIARAEAAWAKGAEAVELRLDGLTAIRTPSVSDRPAEPIEKGQEPSYKITFDRALLAPVREYLASRPKRQFILTCRSVQQGGWFAGTEDDFAALLLPFILFDNVIFDVEFSPEVNDVQHIEVYSTGEGNRPLEKRGEVPPEQWAKFQEAMEIITKTGKPPAWLAKPHHILSTHDTEGKGVDAKPILDFASNIGPVGAITKIARAAPHITDSFAALDLMHEFRERTIAIAMGEDGLWTRLLAKKLGAFGTFASLEADAATAPGQLTIDEMVNLYRWREITADTEVYGVIGDPVAHSLSPVLFNHWFAEHDVNAVYLPLRVRGGDEGLRRFLSECTARPWLDIGGFSVTIPHKEAALAWLGTPSDNLTRSIGALNTLCFREGKAFGYNTDCYAAVASVAEALGRRVTDLAGLRIDVLGAGGAARAILEGFANAGCRLTIFARSLAEAVRLGEEFHCDAAAWDQRGKEPADILINTTPVGMWPEVDQSPMDDIHARSCGGSEGPTDQGSATTNGEAATGPMDQRENVDAANQYRERERAGLNEDAFPQSSIDNRQSPIPRDLSRYRLVFDLIYRPEETRLLRHARAAGCQTLNGLDMFLRQASMQFEMWTGHSIEGERYQGVLSHKLMNSGG